MEMYISGEETLGGKTVDFIRVIFGGLMKRNGHPCASILIFSPVVVIVVLSFA